MNTVLRQAVLSAIAALAFAAPAFAGGLPAAVAAGASAKGNEDSAQRTATNAPTNLQPNAGASSAALGTWSGTAPPPRKPRHHRASVGTASVK